LQCPPTSSASKLSRPKRAPYSAACDSRAGSNTSKRDPHPQRTHRPHHLHAARPTAACANSALQHSVHAVGLHPMTLRAVPNTRPQNCELLPARPNQPINVVGLSHHSRASGLGGNSSVKLCPGSMPLNCTNRSGAADPRREPRSCCCAQCDHHAASSSTLAPHMPISRSFQQTTVIAVSPPPIPPASSEHRHSML
jgi:hypothetical protein